MIKLLRRFLWWLFDFESLKFGMANRLAGMLADDREVVIARSKEYLLESLRGRRMPVYVTLRGYYIREGLEVAHGWTQRVDLVEDQSCSLAFDPYNVFRCERVDILGPAEITGVNVGNQHQTFPSYQNCATLEFTETAELGNRVVVHLKGMK